MQTRHTQWFGFLGLVAVLLGVPALPGTVWAQEEQERGTITVQMPQYQSRYYAHVPERWSLTVARPLVVVLHPSGGEGQESLRQWERTCTSREWYVLAVRSRSAPQGWNLDEGPFVLACVDDFANRVAIDRQRVFLTGFSAGGHATVTLGVLNHERFAAIAAVSGVLSGQRFVQEARDLPIFLLCGEDDPNFPAVRRTHQNLQELGFTYLRFDTYPGLGHQYPRDGLTRIAAFFNDYGTLGLMERCLAGAREALQENRFAEAAVAIRTLRDIVDTEVTDAQVQRRLMDLQQHITRLETQYAQAWEAFLEANPEEARPASLYARAVESEEEGELVRAVEAYATILEDFPESQIAELARSRFEAIVTGPGGEAVADEVAGRDAERPFRRAERYFDREDYAHARPLYEEVIVAFPHTSFARIARERLAAMPDEDEE